MKRQLKGGISDIIAYNRYELRAGEVGKVETDSTKSSNDSNKISHIMKSMLLHISKHCPLKNLAIESMIMPGLNINFFQLVSPNGYVCVMNKKSDFHYSAHTKGLLKKTIPLLKQIWVNKLTMEARFDVVLTVEPITCENIIPSCFQKLQ
ncbi:hypothetical protein RMATCC62417_00813 [Rhizopus microsporus]|nr:hypothetical protein RMATCC62417_00813 [Rhizopus microsporus]